MIRCPSALFVSPVKDNKMHVQMSMCDVFKMVNDCRLQSTMSFIIINDQVSLRTLALLLDGILKPSLVFLHKF